MELSKKLLLALAALALVSVGFMGCGEDDDDPYEMISGSNKNYTINHENTEATVHRGYHATTFKHRGEVVKFTFDNPKSDGGVLGFIWDLDTTDKASGARDFWVLGLQLNSNGSSGLKYYVSRYFNVTDTQAWNFGAGVVNGTYPNGSSTGYTVAKDAIASIELADGPKEYEASSGSISGITVGSDPIVIWADIYPVGDSHEIGTQDKNQTGAFAVRLYKNKTNDKGEDELDKENVLTDLLTFDKDVTGYDGQPKQKNLAVYANVYASKELNGSWYLSKDYAEAEVIEDAE